MIRNNNEMDKVALTMLHSIGIDILDATLMAKEALAAGAAPRTGDPSSMQRWAQHEKRSLR